jgi:hypothetical protein
MTAVGTSATSQERGSTSVFGSKADIEQTPANDRL